MATDSKPPSVPPADLRAALAREHEKLRALQDISVALGSTLDLNELLTLVLERTSRVMDAERSTLYLLDEHTGELWSKFAQGEEVHEIRVKLGEGLAGWVAKTGKALNIKDAYQDSRFDSEWDRRTGYRTQSILCTPMKNHHGRTIGVVQVLNKCNGYFSKEDEGLLSALASQAAVSIENSKLFLSIVGKNMELLEAKSALELKIRELDVLFEIMQVAAEASKLDEMLDGVLMGAVRAVDAEAGAILMLEGDNRDLHFRAAIGGVPDEVKKMHIEAGHGISGWVAQHGLPQIVTDVRKDPRYSRELADRVGYHPRSMMCVPLRWEDGVGAIELFNKSKGKEAFTDDDVKFASVIAGQVSNAIGLALSREKQAREDRLSTIGQLLSGVIHDLKTPMTVISGYLQLLMNEPEDATRHTFGQAALRQIQLVDSMTREILAFARGETTLFVSKVYLHKFFGEIVEQLEKQFRDRGITVKLELADKGVVYFDQQKMQRAVYNLARNAAEALGKRGGEFTMSASRRTADGAVILTFSDNGPGIAEEIRGRLFQSFATHGKEGGTGLGLAIVKKVVDDHQGTIDVASSQDGTIFTMVLPQSANHTSSTGDTKSPNAAA
ncbi:MAG: GAF domain-containing protein [Sandaracinaceae bacterium]|nr:GAF domain-containing protein [Sandaracinaceae bacterium]